jgi:hypothetical protein
MPGCHHAKGDTNLGQSDANTDSASAKVSARALRIFLENRVADAHIQSDSSLISKIPAFCPSYQ